MQKCNEPSKKESSGNIIVIMVHQFELHLVWGSLSCSLGCCLITWKCFVDSPDWLGVIQASVRVVPSKSCLCSSARHSATGIRVDHITSWGEESRPGLGANTGYSHNLISYESLNNQHTQGSGLTKIVPVPVQCTLLACLQNLDGVTNKKSSDLSLEILDEHQVIKCVLFSEINTGGGENGWDRC